MWFDGEKASLRRRDVPIIGYVGANGSGKSLLAVADAVHTLRENKRVLSSVRLLDWENPRPCDDDFCDFAMHPDHGAAHPLWVPLRNWQQVLDAEHCHILLDEVTGMLSSRESAAMPALVADKLMQFRRADVTVAWTAPAWARADVMLREITQAAVLARGHRRRAAAGQSWRTSTIISSRMVDARDLDDMTQSIKTGTSYHMPSIMVRSVQLVSRTLAKDVYHTLDSVTSLNAGTRRGPCLICGGTQTAPKCQGHGEAGAAAPVSVPRRVAAA